MRRQLRKIKNYLDLTPPERSFNPDKSTIMLVSYPKSGNTWLRFIFANLIQDSSVGFSNIEKIVPDIYQTNKRAFKRSSYLYVKSHESFITTYNRVVYVVRDPRDVFLSYFNYHKKIKVLPMDFSRELYLKMFLTGDIIESEKFGSWSQHLLSWYHVSKNENVCFIKYEDLLHDTEKQIKKVVRFFNLDYKEQDIKSAIENSSFRSMKTSEKIDGGRWRTLKKSRTNLSFVDKGKSERWKNELTDTEKNLICEHFKKGMKIFGYVK